MGPRAVVVALLLFPALALGRLDPLKQLGTAPCLSAASVPTIGTTTNCLIAPYDYDCLQSGLNFGEGVNPPLTGPLNYQTDAMTGPETFTIPKDASGNYVTVTFRLMMEEAGYENIFGWYNVGDRTKHYPALFSCYLGNLYNPPSRNAATPPLLVGGHVFTVNFQAEYAAGRYAGGKVGFYIVTPQGNATGSMCAADPSANDQGTLASGGPINDDDIGTAADDANGFGRIYYSETAYNGAEPYPHILIYQSKSNPTHFYFAIEDMWSGGDMDYDDLLVKVEGLVSSLSGDYVTGAPGVATSGLNGTEGDWALIPSVEYPGWKGHLRVYDVTQATPPVVWDAATDLNTRAAYSREIYTGFPSYNPGGGVGSLVELLKSDGTLFSGASVRGVLAAAGSANSTLTDAQLEPFFRWLYGATRAHRLPPIIRSVPATVGPPASRNLDGHTAFASAHATRPRLIYVTSNEGLIHAFRSGPVSGGGGVEVFAFLPPALFDKVYALYLAGGQASPPIGFKYILASSPRVDDVYDGSAWHTQLVVPFGPGSKGFVALDVTDPVNCSTTPCTLNASLKVLGMGYDSAGTVRVATSAASAVVTSLGESWSHPALYWEESGGAAVCRASLGSGYGAATTADHYVSQTSGHYYNYFATPWSTPTTYQHAPPAAASAKVDYAVLADTAAAVNWDATAPAVIATYQADLSGRLVRFDEGKHSGASAQVLLAQDVTRPLYYSPAVLHIGGTSSDKVVLAFASAAADEGCPPTPDLTAKLYLRAHTSGASFDADHDLTCDVGSLQTCAGLDTSGITNASLWPPATAQPSGSPLLVLNDLGGGTTRVEAFYLLYDEDSKTSYRVRISVSSSSGSLRVEEIFKTSGRLGGMTLGGGGTRILMSKSGGGSTAASADHGGSPVANALMTSPPRIEAWREVR